jgi:hypothetical protein
MRGRIPAFPFPPFLSFFLKKNREKTWKKGFSICWSRGVKATWDHDGDACCSTCTKAEEISK